MFTQKAKNARGHARNLHQLVTVNAMFRCKCCNRWLAAVSGGN